METSQRLEKSRKIERVLTKELAMSKIKSRKKNSNGSNEKILNEIAELGYGITFHSNIMEQFWMSLTRRTKPNFFKRNTSLFTHLLVSLFYL